jgi:hypothetical protein
MDEIDQTVKGALDTILWFEDALTEVEAKTGELFHILENKNIDPEPIYEIFKVFSQIRFHMAESHEYQALLNNRQSRKYSRRGLPEPEREQPVSPPPAAQPAANSNKPLHKRVESRLAALLKNPFFPLRKVTPQPEQPPLM